MKIGVYRDQIENSKSYNIKGEIVFSPLAEMMASMHVICNPAHHIYNQKWMQRVETKLSSELIEKIKYVGTFTSDWLIPIDIAYTDSFIDLELMDSLNELNRISFKQFQKLFSKNNTSVTVQQIEKMRITLMEYAVAFFREELLFLQPMLIHELRKVFKQWHETGIEASLYHLHDRLMISDKGVTFRKRIDYFYSWKNMKLIIYTASIFLAPHLIMNLDEEIVQFTKCFHTESGSLEPPEDLVNQYHVLGDPTRLKILKLLKNNPDTTQNLAKKLGISEAAVSKQLKLLMEVSFVTKRREGYYQYYSIEKENLEFMTYRLFEYI